MADLTIPAYPGGAGVLKTLKDMGDGTHAEVVAFTADSPVELTGDVVVDTLGALDDAAESDPDAASATMPSILRGMLAEMQAQTALLTTMSGLLDDIKTNTA